MKNHIAPNFPDFHLYKGGDLVRVCSPLLHGIAFEQASDESMYVSCFIQFLFEPKDYLAIGFGERMRRLDKPGRSFKPEPAELEAKQLLSSMQQSSYSPFNLIPTCTKIIEISGKDTQGVHELFGLGCCALHENGPDLAVRYFKLAREQLKSPKYRWQKDISTKIDRLHELIDDIQSARFAMGQWVEESIRLLGMENFV